ITGVSVDVMNRTRQCRMAPERAAALHENLPLLDSVKVRVHDGVAELSDGIDLGLHRVGRYGLFELPDIHALLVLAAIRQPQRAAGTRSILGNHGAHDNLSIPAIESWNSCPILACKALHGFTGA